MKTNKMVRCGGGCGKTQDVIIKPKGTDGFTSTRPWTCPACKEKEAKRKAKEEATRSAPQTVTKPDPGFTIRPRRVAEVASSVQRVSDGRLVSKPAPVPAPAPVQVTEADPAGDEATAAEDAGVGT